MSAWSSTHAVADYTSHRRASTSEAQMFSSMWLKESVACPVKEAASSMLAHTCFSQLLRLRFHLTAPARPRWNEKHLDRSCSDQTSSTEVVRLTSGSSWGWAEDFYRVKMAAVKARWQVWRRVERWTSVFKVHQAMTRPTVLTTSSLYVQYICTRRGEQTSCLVYWASPVTSNKLMLGSNVNILNKLF